MAVDFASLRSGNSADSLAKLQKTLEKSDKSKFKDDRVWKYGRNEKTNKSVSIIRLLPVSAKDLELVEAGKALAEDLSPFVKFYKNNIKGPSGRFFNRLSPKTFGEPDPVSDWTAPQWADLKKLGEANPEYKARKEALMKFFPKENMFCNILVISDSEAPENNGKVFLFQFSAAVRKMIKEAAEPAFEGEGFDPFNPWTGKNLELKLVFETKKLGGNDVWVPDFEHCSWSAASAIGDDAEIERVWRESYALQEFMDRSNLLDVDAYKKEFCAVMDMDENYNPIPKGAGSSSAATGSTSASASAPAQGSTAVNVMDAVSLAPASTTVTATTTAAPVNASEASIEDLDRLLRGG